jgi:hypothetical protein
MPSQQDRLPNPDCTARILPVHHNRPPTCCFRSAPRRVWLRRSRGLAAAVQAVPREPVRAVPHVVEAPPHARRGTARPGWGYFSRSLGGATRFRGRTSRPQGLPLPALCPVGMRAAGEPRRPRAAWADRCARSRSAPLRRRVTRRRTTASTSVISPPP